jgi:hypothetical protein
MLSLKQCRKIIDPKNEKFTDEQLLAIRVFLTEIAILNVQLYYSVKEKESFNKKDEL